MIEYFIYELGYSNSEKALKGEVNSRLILTEYKCTKWRVRETRHFPVVENIGSISAALSNSGW